MQIVDENIGQNIINVVEMYDKKGEDTIFHDVSDTLKDISGAIINVERIPKSAVLDYFIKEADLVYVRNLSKDDTVSTVNYSRFKMNLNTTTLTR
jgi:accessory colonization factor AcfC